jgi:hypothetical protein
MKTSPRCFERSPSAVEIRALSAAEDELDWLFTRAESDLGRWSSYIPLIVEHLSSGARVGPIDEEDAMIARIDAAKASRTIRAWIRQMPRTHVETLAAAYEERAFPERTRKAFGRLASIAVRLASARDAFDGARAHRATKARTVSEWIEETLARDGLRGVASIKWEAQGRWVEALNAYRAVRDRGKSVAPR